MKHLPNALSLSRFILGPVVCIADTTGHIRLAWWLFVIATVTDFIDGPLARRLNAVTPLGANLDRYGDASLLFGTYIGLIGGGQFPSWVILFILPSTGIHLMLRRSAQTAPPDPAASQVLADYGAMVFVMILVAFGFVLAIGAYGVQRWYGLVLLALITFLCVTRRHRLPFWPRRIKS
jgi:phosphatidylglycerophosphate synthase